MDINEYNKYKNDKMAFVTKFFQAMDFKRGKYVHTIPYKHQKVMFKENDHLLIRKARQTGITDAIAFEIAYNLNYIKDCNMVVVCPTRQMSLYVRDKVIRHFNCIPDNIRVGLGSQLLKNTYATEIGACVEFQNGDAHTFSHGMSYDVVYIEEADAMNDFDTAYITLFQTLSRRNGRMVISSTPMGGSVNTPFEKLWTAPNKFNKLDVTTNSHSYNIIDEKSLNALSKKQYNKIIKECVIQ